jgi:carbamoyl-phosphate synthase large subunit
MKDITIIGLCFDAAESGAHSGDCDAVYLLPYPSQGERALLERLDDIRSTHKLDVAIPCLDNEILNYIAIKEDLKARGIRVALPSANTFRRRSKSNLYKLCRSLNIQSPKTVAAPAVEQAKEAAEKLGYPVMLKGIEFGGVKVVAADEVARTFYQLGAPMLVQEFIEPEDEYCCVGLGDGKGNVVGSCTIRKTTITALGKAHGGIAVQNPDIDAAVGRLVRALKWRGLFEIEFIYDGEDYQATDFNPRAPAWIDFPSQIGCNLPVALIDMLSGRTPKLGICEPGMMFCRHHMDIAFNLADMANLMQQGVI